MSLHEEEHLETDRPLFSPRDEENLNKNLKNNKIYKTTDELNIPTTERPLNSKADNDSYLEFKENFLNKKKSKENLNEYKSKISVFSNFVSKPKSKNIKNNSGNDHENNVDNKSYGTDNFKKNNKESEKENYNDDPNRFLNANYNIINNDNIKSNKSYENNNNNYKKQPNKKDFSIRIENNNSDENNNKNNTNKIKHYSSNSVLHKLEKINNNKNITNSKNNTKSETERNFSHEKNNADNNNPDSKNSKENKIGNFTFFFFFANKADYVIFILATLISILSGTSGAVYSYLVGYTIRIFSAENSNEYIKTDLPNVLILYLTVAICLFVINYLSFFLWNFISFKSAYKFKKITIKNLLSQRQEVFDAINHKEINDYLQKKFAAISGIGKETGILMQNVSRIFSGLIIAFMVSWKLTLVLGAVAPLIVICNKLLLKFISQAQEKSFANVAQANKFLHQTLSNFKFINASVCFQANYGKYKEILLQGKKLSLVNNKRISFFLACLFFLKYVQFPIAMYFSAHLIFDNEKNPLLNARLSGGEVSTVIFCVIFIGFQVNGLIDNLAALANGKAAAADLLELASDYVEEYFRNKKARKVKKLNKTNKILKEFKDMESFVKKFEKKEILVPQLTSGQEENNNIDNDKKIINDNNDNNQVIGVGGVWEKPEIKKDSVAADTPKAAAHSTTRNLKGKIEFINVCFAFPQQQEKRILNNYSFLIEPGKKIGIIGGSRTGKTTIVNLIQKLYEIDSGKILINDTSIEYFKTKDLQNLIGYAGKNPVLFNMSISDNIIFFRDIIKNNISSEKIRKASISALANRFIERLKEKYDYAVSIQENKLTKTQMQKIAIARALLLSPKILVLDEATEIMEISKEKKLIDSITSSNPGLTLILISNRAKSVMDLDAIIAMKDSQNYEVGSHKELIQRRGIYSEFYKKQVENDLAKFDMDNTFLSVKEGKKPSLNLNLFKAQGIGEAKKSILLRKISNNLKPLGGDKSKAQKNVKFDDHLNFSSEKILKNQEIKIKNANENRIKNKNYDDDNHKNNYNNNKLRERVGVKSFGENQVLNVNGIFEENDFNNNYNKKELGKEIHEKNENNYFIKNENIQENENSIQDLKFKENEDLFHTLQQISFFNSEKDEHSDEQHSEEKGKEKSNKAKKSSSFDYKSNKHKKGLEINFGAEKDIAKKISYEFNDDKKNFNFNKKLLLEDQIKEKNSYEIIKNDFERIIKEKNYDEENKSFYGKIINNDNDNNNINNVEKSPFSRSRKSENIFNNIEGIEKSKENKGTEIKIKIQEAEAVKEVDEKINIKNTEPKQINLVTNKLKTILKNKNVDNKENKNNVHLNDNNKFVYAPDSNNNLNIFIDKFETQLKTHDAESYPIIKFKENIITENKNNYTSNKHFESNLKKTFTNKFASSKMIRKLSEHCKQNSISRTTNNLIKINLDQITKANEVTTIKEPDIKNDFKNFSTKNLTSINKPKQNLNLNLRNVLSMKAAMVPNRVVITPNYNFKLSYDKNEDNFFSNNNDINNIYKYNNFDFDDDHEKIKDDVYFYNQSFARINKRRNLNFDNEIKEETETENVSSRFAQSKQLNISSNNFHKRSSFYEIDNDNNNNYNKNINVYKRNKSNNEKESNINFRKFLSTKMLTFYSQLNQSNSTSKKQSEEEKDNQNKNQNKIKLNFNQSNSSDNKNNNNNNFIDSYQSPLDKNFKKYVTIDDELLLLAFQKIAENSENKKLIYLKKCTAKEQTSLFSFLANQKLNTFLLLLNLTLSAMVEPCFCIILSGSLSILSGDKMNLLLADSEKISWIYFSISFIPFIVNFFLQFFSTKVKEQYISNLRLCLLRKLQKVHFSFYDMPENYPAVALCAKINADIANVNSIFLPNLEDIIKSFVLFFVGITIAFTYDWRLTFIGSLFIPLLFFSLMIQFKFKKNLINNINLLNQEANCIFIEAIKNTKIIFGFGVQKNVYRKYKHFMKDRIINLNRQNLITGLVYGLEEFINFLNYCFSFYFGGYFIVNGSLDFGTMIKTVFAIATFLLGMAAMHKGISEYPAAKLSVDRLFSILDIEDYVFEEENGNGKGKGEVSESENSFNRDLFKEEFVKEKLNFVENLERKPINDFEIVNDNVGENENNIDINVNGNNQNNLIKDEINIKIADYDYGKSSNENNSISNNNNAKSKNKGFSKESKSTSEFSKSENNLKNEIKGKIQFKNVYFSYPERPEEIILKGVNFIIEPGQKVAIVGSLDSGKSLIIDMIERFYDVCHGEILIDDINIKNYDIISLRKQIGFVMEKVCYCKSESIVDNLKYGNSKASEAQVTDCFEKFDLLKIVELEREIITNKSKGNKENKKLKNLIMDYKNDIVKDNYKDNDYGIEKNKDTVKNTTEEKSENLFNDLSEFDMLKISIGREKLKNPKIIIFDNSLSYLNYKSEKEIDKLIKKAIEKTSAINIIDKPFSMKKYDLILYFEDGIVIEQGRHKNLMKLKGFYWRLYNEYK